ncbi:efflux RND transporter periplasmic adaptor subunit [Pantanalinema rosaneae CENA516]|uniref:efflux RND transporter periplasmic adaptor subunit n=1 Tax=Pantanalinema rosaneae TaxID=1620701 RepID=UPI003D6DE35F
MSEVSNHLVDDSEPSNSVAVQEQRLSPVTSSESDAELPRSPRRSASQRWLAIGGLILLTLGVGFGWRWWQANSASQAPAGGGFGQQALPVNLQTTKLAAVQETSTFVGSLESQRSVALKPEITGRISDILVQAGDRVSPGTPVVQLRPDKRQAEVAGELAQVNSARASRNNAQAEVQALEAERAANVADVDLQNEEYRRISVLVREGALSRQQLDQVERDRNRAVALLNAINKRIQAARANLAQADAQLQTAQANANLASEQLQDTTIVAPFTGVVGDIPVRLGQLVTTDDTLTTITQNQSLDLRLQIPIARASELRPGLRVQLTNQAGQVLSNGQISFIAPQVDTRAQSVLAKATFDNTQGRLRDGQFVSARVIWQEQPGILIPAAAISRLGGETFVFVAQSPDDTCQSNANGAPAAPDPSAKAPELVARQRPVKLGDSLQGNAYPVLQGLKSGEQVVVSGILNLSDCAPIAPQ